MACLHSCDGRSLSLALLTVISLIVFICTVTYKLINDDNDVVALLSFHKFALDLPKIYQFTTITMIVTEGSCKLPRN